MSHILRWLVAALMAASIMLIPACRGGSERGDSAAPEAPPETTPEATEQKDAPAPEEAAAVQPGTWHRNLDDALAEAKERETLVLVDAYADWCGWCRKLDEETLASPKVRERLREFALLKLDTDKHGSLARRFGVRGLPTTLILDASGRVVDKQPGYMPPDAYLGFIERAVKKAE